MRKPVATLLTAVFGISLFATFGALAHDPCDDPGAHSHAASGSCKYRGGANEGQLRCAPDDAPGEVPASAGSVRFFVNPDDGEVEACNDEGAGVTRGRFVVKVDSDEGYVRLSLDSTIEQEPNVDAGYINVQVGPGADETGVWCSGSGNRGDGYSRPSDSPGPQGGNVTQPDAWVECVPGQ